jgi:hypothetical protein
LELGLWDYGFHLLGWGVIPGEWTSWGGYGVFIDMRLLG